MAISPQLGEHNRSIVEEHGLSFDVLSDPGNWVAGTFGLVIQFPEDMRDVQRGLGLDLERFNGDDSWTLPLPARYIIAADRSIQYAVRVPDINSRIDPAETLEALRQMAP